MAIRTGIFALTLLLLNTIEATEYQPWLGEPFQFEWRNSIFYQDYNHVVSGAYNFHHCSHDYFATTSISNSLPGIGLELEVTAASTRMQRYNFDNIKGTGRYLIFDDLTGDYLSIVGGLSLSGVSHGALYDVASCHHGYFEGELFLSFGKELLRAFDDWKLRLWGMSSFGVGSRGSPWVKAKVNVDYRPWYCHAFSLYTFGWVGLGQHWFYFHNFHGYGSIQHLSIDVGAKYTYFIELLGELSVDCFHRVRVRNFPDNATGIKIELMTTFGL